MAGVKPLVGLAFTGSIGLLFLFLACALPQFDNWIPFTVIIFYLMAPIPTLFAKRRAENASGSSPFQEFAWFLTTGIVVSAFALPVVLARAPVALTPGAPIPSNGNTTGIDEILDLEKIKMFNTITSTPATNTTPNPSVQFTTVIDGGACGLVLAANSVMFLTILGFFLAFDSEDVEYSVW